jgi:hypothetical protein
MKRLDELRVLIADAITLVVTVAIMRASAWAVGHVAGESWLHHVAMGCEIVIDAAVLVRFAVRAAVKEVAQIAKALKKLWKDLRD